MSKDYSFADRIQNAFARTVLGGALLLPYKTRVALVGRVFRHVVAPLAGWNKRVEANLRYVWPELDAGERKRIRRGVTDNVGRTIIEIYSGDEYIAHAKPAEYRGPGLETLESLRNSDRPVVVISGHIGNYDAMRSKLQREGWGPLGTLYRPMSNAMFNQHYVKAMAHIAAPFFPTDRGGIAGLIKHLREGGTVAIAGDVGSRKAPLLEFFGKPAHTPLSAFEWAVKYDAVVMPLFGLRESDGFGFHIYVAEAIPLGDPTEMAQQFNDLLEELVREYPEQWFWVHNRWKLSGPALASLENKEKPSAD